MNDLVLEFFYEGIRRITPGLIILVLYWHQETVKFFIAHQYFFSTPYLFIVCILPIAWLIGFMIEVVTLVPFEFVLRLLPRRFKRINMLVRFLFGEEAKEADLKLNELYSIPARLRWNQFLFAEIVMCRCLASICLFACCDLPEKFLTATLFDTRIFWFGGFVIFSIAWLWRKPGAVAFLAFLFGDSI